MSPNRGELLAVDVPGLSLRQTPERFSAPGISITMRLVALSHTRHHERNQTLSPKVAGSIPARPIGRKALG